MNSILFHINFVIMYWNYKCEFYPYTFTDKETYLVVANWSIEDYRRECTYKPAVSF